LNHHQQQQHHHHQQLQQHEWPTIPLHAPKEFFECEETLGAFDELKVLLYRRRLVHNPLNIIEGNSQMGRHPDGQAKRVACVYAQLDRTRTRVIKIGSTTDFKERLEQYQKKGKDPSLFVAIFVFSQLTPSQERELLEQLESILNTIEASRKIKAGVKMVARFLREEAYRFGEKRRYMLHLIEICLQLHEGLRCEAEGFTDVSSHVDDALAVAAATAEEFLPFHEPLTDETEVFACLTWAPGLDKIDPVRYGPLKFPYATIGAIELVYGIPPGDDPKTNSFTDGAPADDPYMNRRKFTDEEIKQSHSNTKRMVSQMHVPAALNYGSLMKFCTIRLRSIASERFQSWH
jgi:hypothetical protein